MKVNLRPTAATAEIGIYSVIVQQVLEDINTLV